MCLSARIGPTLADAIKNQDPNTIFSQMTGIYVIVLLHSYFQYSDALCLKECGCTVPHHDGCLYRVVQKAINVLWFRHMNRVCRAHQQQYNSMPIPAVALAMTVV